MLGKLARVLHDKMQFLRSATKQSSPNFIYFMKIFRVLGLALAIIMIRFLVPEIFHALENTLLVFLDTVQTVFVKAETGPNTASLINLLPR